MFWGVDPETHPEVSGSVNCAGLHTLRDWKALVSVGEGLNCDIAEGFLDTLRHFAMYVTRIPEWQLRSSLGFFSVTNNKTVVTVGWY